MHIIRSTPFSRGKTIFITDDLKTDSNQDKNKGRPVGITTRMRTATLNNCSAGSKLEIPFSFAGLFAPSIPHQKQ
jgi:hypothetical protein